MTQDTIKTGKIFIKDIDRIDCAVFDPAIGIIGESWFVDISVAGKLDDNGFVYDFSNLKSLVKQVLKSTVDHALIIPISSAQVRYKDSHDGNESWELHVKSRITGADTKWEYSCPKGAVYPIRTVKITPKIIEQECSRLFRHRLPEDIDQIDVTLRKENDDLNASYFRYTHGITKHDGLCQRTFHGHRSKIEVFVGHERRIDLEQYLAREVLGSMVHIAGMDQTRGHPTDKDIQLAYNGTDGFFQATIPANKVFFVENETLIIFSETQLIMELSSRRPAKKMANQLRELLQSKHCTSQECFP